MEKKLPSVEDLLINGPLYKSYLISEEMYEQIYYLEYYNGTIDAFCIYCKENSTFQGKNITDDNVQNLPQCILHHHGIPRLPYDNSIIQEEKEKSIADRTFTTKLFCTRNRRHYMFFNFIISDNTITKFGQFPSIADINIGNNNKYQKILGDKYYEFNRAIGLYSHGIGIGAFVYLRRIFEYLIMVAFQAAKDTLKLKEEIFYSKRMEEKILLLKDFLPEFLVKNKILHSILSKGIHSLSEEECLKYFGSIKVGIELILDEKIEIELKRKKVESVSKELNNIKGNIN